MRSTHPLLSSVHLACLLVIVPCLSPSLAAAASDNAKVIHTPLHKPGSKAEAKSAVIALVSMDEVLPDCQQQVTVTKVKTVAYSESGITPQSIGVDWLGRKLDIATNVGENPVLTLEEIQAANQFIKIGKRYLIHFQLCGNDGSQRSLINMYAEQVPPARPLHKIKT
jgi:hypothetical protein